MCAQRAMVARVYGLLASLLVCSGVSAFVHMFPRGQTVAPVFQASCSFASHRHHKRISARHTGGRASAGHDLGVGGVSRRVPRGVLALRAQDDEVVNVGDVVEYALPEGGKTVGLVEEISAEEYLQIIPLVRREGVGEECYVDETQPYAVISRTEVRFINVYPSQRVAWSTASPHHNPHGEESEDCYFIEDELSPECQIPVKWISDT